MNIIQAVPTNIITGFLGAGKTTAILHLLKMKPEQERWAVLVNEFGEIGIDGSLFKGSETGENGIFIREVPGGCMCCTSGLPMQMALNMLLKVAKPDRLLIEPTGLGHPKEVLDTLSSEHYQSVLTLHSTISLVDARNLQDSRYTSHEIFNQQLEIADIVVGNKSDLYQSNDKEALENYLSQSSLGDKKLAFTSQGKLEVEWLSGNSSYISHQKTSRLQNSRAIDNQDTGDTSSEIPIEGFLRSDNKGEGFSSCGWQFAPDITFDRKKLFAFLSGLEVERAKAVFITSEGLYGYNKSRDALTEMELDECLDSRIEIISASPNDSWEQAILNCQI
ncbi:GTP-binding protein [Parendozoicomonas sp. Alg238-R29]|uniref:CobW family GTP-binding protein n=1 Tax=Parendozoicomonas sp. Alg238-R29 TaxID=2993446 RepID=UPI00248E13DA|nr:GTP-binding protein [Parendozoicomonas sp. Alg238-R29]